MKLEYDTDAQALDIELADLPVARTVEIDSGTLIDLAADGRVVAIEVIQPERSWPLRQILDGYEVDAASAQMLEALWPNPRGGGYGAFYPTGSRVPVAAFAAA